jgi:hypothetical protein
MGEGLQVALSLAHGQAGVGQVFLKPVAMTQTDTCSQHNRGESQERLTE